MPSVSLIAAAAVTSTVGLAMLFRRRAPTLTDEDLDKIPGIPPNVRVAKRGLSPEQREVLKDAFLSGSDFRWLTVGDIHVKTNFDDPSSKITQKHKKVTYYMVECVLRFAERYGYVLVLTEKTRASKEPGKFLGSICLIPPYSSEKLFRLHFLSAVFPMGLPIVQGMGGGAEERFDAYTTGMEKNHHDVMDGTSHWYIANLGVAKSAQGKGVGKQLMKTAVAIAGSEPVYLECHDQNVSFYEKMGFRHARQYEFEVKNDKSKTSIVPYSYNCMVYDGKQ